MKTIQDHLLRLVICEPSSLPTGCWEWPGAKNPDGYGLVSVGGRGRSIHCAVYEHFVGPVPDGCELDHLCRNRACANYEHLEPVTHKVNLLRGTGFGARNARKTHCVRGHELTPENCYRRGETRKCISWRQCKQCDSDFKRSQRQAAREARGETPHWQSKKTHCPHGHEYSPENTRISGGKRYCIQCARASQKKRKKQ